MQMEDNQMDISSQDPITDKPTRRRSLLGWDRVCFFIARRYLFSKKKTHAINVISMISVIQLRLAYSSR